MREMDKLLQQYVEKFEDNFPIFFVRHLGEEEIKELIKKAIENNKPYEAGYEEQGVY